MIADISSICGDLALNHTCVNLFLISSFKKNVTVARGD